ncbi:MAG: serine/threonine protein phosphatase [Lachnospiraceae bacterium]|nr:serine/threonine protein phosphatase [Lachnospiraceae bacterium]
MKRTLKRLDDVWKKAPVISFNDETKIVIMSDCHRGIANWGDNFAPNQNLFFAALNYYDKNGYAYIELGDGDELWENRSMEQVMRAYSDAFWMMSEFYKKNRFLMVSGNHDKVKEKDGFALQYLEESFPGIKIREGLRLKYECSGNEIFLAHGHQGDLLNDTLWWLGRFLVRYVWRPLELFGVNDPTDAGKSYEKANRVERKLQRWVEEQQTTLITGHTHRPRLTGELPAYLNTGSCVHPRCITAMELSDGELILVKWAVYVQRDNALKIEREVLEGPVKIV